MVSILINTFLDNNHSYTITCLIFIKYLNIYFPEINVFVNKIDYYNDYISDNAIKLELNMYNNEPVDKVLNWYHPYSFDADFTFLTVENGIYFDTSYFKQSVSEIIKSKCKVITPSYKSKFNIPIKMLRDKTHVIKHFIDPELYNVVNKRDSNHFTFLNISALSGNKNALQLLKAFQILRNEFGGYLKLILKCNNKLYKTEILEQYQNSLEGVNIILDDLPFSEISNLYNKSDCYVSCGRFEGFDLPVLEANYHDCKVILSSEAPLAEYFPENCYIKSEGDTGINLNSLVSNMKSAILGKLELQKKIPIDSKEEITKFVKLIF